MVEHRRGVEEKFEHEHRQRRGTKGNNRREFDGHGERDFDRMKSCARGDVHFRIGVMHPVQPPQARYSVKQNVLQVNRAVESHDGDRHREPGRGLPNVKQAPTSGLGEQGDRDSAGGKEQSHDERIEDENGDVARPACGSGRPAEATRREHLPGGEDDEQRDERAETQEGFVLCQMFRQDRPLPREN